GFEFPNWPLRTGEIHLT
ncbi:hypothetical protein Zm00014a_014674, partial [Zea mays]